MAAASRAGSASNGRTSRTIANTCRRWASVISPGSAGRSGSARRSSRRDRASWCASGVAASTSPAISPRTTPPGPPNRYAPAASTATAPSRYAVPGHGRRARNSTSNSRPPSSGTTGSRLKAFTTRAKKQASNSQVPAGGRVEAYTPSPRAMPGSGPSSRVTACFQAAAVSPRPRTSAPNAGTRNTRGFR